MSREQLNLEELLEHMGTDEVPGDSVHRYALRRKLLCSRFFGDHCERTAKINRVFTYTAPLFAGGVMVGMFVFFASFTSFDSGAVEVSTSAEVVEFVEMPAMANIQVNEFVSDPAEPKVQLAEFERGDTALMETVASAN
jgi:hypothetical protein